MSKVDEVGPDLYRISVFAPEFQLQFNHFLVKDDEPLLTKKSAMMTRMDAVTTACVVERPTPRVPPVVLMPK